MFQTFEYTAFVICRRINPATGFAMKPKVFFITFKATGDIDACQQTLFALAETKRRQRPPFWHIYELIGLAEVQHLIGRSDFRKIRKELFEFYRRRAA